MFDVVFGGFEHVKQPAQGLQVAAGFAEQRRQVAGVELAGHIVLPVLRGLVPGVVEQAELLIAVLVRSGRHGIRPVRRREPGRGGRLPGF